MCGVMQVCRYIVTVLFSVGVSVRSNAGLPLYIVPVLFSVALSVRINAGLPLYSAGIV